MYSIRYLLALSVFLLLALPNLAQQPPEYFDEFIAKFSADPDFQKQRVFARHPGYVHWAKQSRSTHTIQDARVSQAQWKHIDFRRSPKNDPIPAEWVFLPVKPRDERHRQILLSGIGNETLVEFTFSYHDLGYDRTTRQRLSPMWILWSVVETVP